MILKSQVFPLSLLISAEDKLPPEAFTWESWRINSMLLIAFYIILHMWVILGIRDICINLCSFECVWPCQCIALAAFCELFRGKWRPVNFQACRAPCSPLQGQQELLSSAKENAQQMLFPQICPKIVLSSSKKIKKYTLHYCFNFLTTWEEFKFQFSCDTVFGIVSNIKRGGIIGKLVVCLVCAMIWRFGVKKPRHDLLCRLYALVPHLQLRMSHSPCTQLINITKTLPLHASGPGSITNLTFIFLFSPSAHLRLLSRAGWTEHRDELRAVGELNLAVEPLI